MKLIGLRLCEHDSNVSYYDGETVRYFKSERVYDVKHHGYSDLHSWKKDFKDIFGDDPEDADEIAIVIDPWVHGLPTDNEEFFPAIKYPTVSDNCWRVNHHYAHALSTFEKNCLHIVIDGFGDENNSWSVFRNGEVVDRGYCDQDGSLGCEMIKAGKLLNIKAGCDLDVAGKLMGLQSYGTYMEEYDRILPGTMHNIRRIFEESRYKSFERDIFGTIGISKLNWIRTVHEHIGNVLVEFFNEYIYHDDDIVSYTGGVAQNVIWNTKLKEKYRNLRIPAHCADEGLSLGALEFLRRKNNIEEFTVQYHQQDIAAETKPSDMTIAKVAHALKQGKIVGWYQGHGEIGPRALGNRSILMNPYIDGAKKKSNRIKNREGYRPFGASILEGYQRHIFDTDITNPHMLYVGKTAAPGLESITHVDGTCRYQTVTQENEDYYKLLQVLEFPILLNTSMNIAGKPIMSKPENFPKGLDMVVVGNDISVL